MARLEILQNAGQLSFSMPSKKINDGDDVNFFLTSTAYADIMTFLLQLNAAMFPAIVDGQIKSWQLGSEAVTFSLEVQKLRALLHRLEAAIEEAPPDPGPRRYGNVSFRKWYEIVSLRIGDILDEFLPEAINDITNTAPAAKDELQAYLLGSFGSAQRLDYGTGHELSFLAFLGAIWKLGGFSTIQPGVEERGIVLGVIEQYLRLIRRLILTYTLEPAGSHGVWGLDDHSFVPYIFGSAQLSPPVMSLYDIPTEGSLDGAPSPTDVVKKQVIDRERKTNMYFSAIGFIYDVKKGPFWEHSPILYDISGVRAGWAKINKGMLKMYNAEVLSKFPVVQHFPFGSLFRWEKNANAASVPLSIHVSSQPQPRPSANASTGQIPARAPLQEGTKAPWATGPSPALPTSTTSAPWASIVPSRTAASAAAGPPMTSAPWAAHTQSAQPGSVETTRAPWRASSTNNARKPQGTTLPTRAPWADQDSQS